MTAALVSGMLFPPLKALMAPEHVLNHYTGSNMHDTSNEEAPPCEQ